MSAFAYLGGALIVAGFAALGMSFSAKLKRRVKTISALISAIDHMEAEISYGLVPLHELVKDLAERDPVLRDFWRAVLSGMQPGSSFQDIWSRQVKTLELREQDSLLAVEIGGVLGRYDADRQVSRLSFIKRKLEYSQKEAREELLKNGRLFCILGVLCGLTIAIVLI